MAFGHLSIYSTRADLTCTYSECFVCDCLGQRLALFEIADLSPLRFLYFVYKIHNYMGMCIEPCTYFHQFERNWPNMCGCLVFELSHHMISHYLGLRANAMGILSI